MKVDRSGQRWDAVEKAVRAADSIILEASDGSVEETNYLTARLAKRFMEKALVPFESAMLRIDIERG